MKKFLCAVLALVMCLGLFAGCQPQEEQKSNNNGDALPTGTYDIKVWVSEIEGVVELTQKQIDAFEAANPGVVINATVEGVSESDAATQVTSDVESAPDIYCFAQDQLARLVQASALAAPGTAATEAITSTMSAVAVATAKVSGKLWAYPMTSDNGYYMYYDKSVIGDTDLNSLEDLIAVCEANNKFFNFELEGSAWYTASFFFATGCVSEWTQTEDGKDFASVNDTFNSPEGLVALKGMSKLLKSSCYQSNSNDFNNAAIVVTGSWNSAAAETAFGENLGAAKLPSFTVDGKTYQLGSFTGGKLMGVKPQTDLNRAKVLQALAIYLTGETCQKERFESFNWGPTNTVVASSDAVKSNVHLNAFSAQAAFGTPQLQIHGSWWDIAKALAVGAKAAEDDTALQNVLDTYKAAIDDLFRLTPEQKRAFTVIGAVNGTTWDTDFPMKEDPTGTWISESAFELAAGAEFKVRQGLSWDVAFGNNTDNADTSIGNKSNFVVETAGKYYVKLVYDETAGTATIELVAAE